MNRHLLSCALLAAAALPAQNLCPDGGQGSVVRSFDLEAATGVDGHVGVAAIGGRFYVSARRRNATSMHRVHVLDAQGAVVAGAGFDQPAALADSAWGLRGMCSDGVGLFAASEAGVFGFDLQGNPLSAIQGAAGAQPFSSPIAGAALQQLGTMRALAFDPNGDAGRGSFWSANLDSALIEFDLSGQVLRSHPRAGDWMIQGLTLDPCNGMLWAFAAPDLGSVVEIDPAGGQLTGRRIAANGAQAGLCHFDEGVATRLAWIEQGPRDRLVVAGLHSFHSICDQPQLLSGLDGGPLDREFKIAGLANTTLELKVDGAAAGASVVMLFNLGSHAHVCGELIWRGTAWASLDELVVVSPYSVPVGVFYYGFTTVGTTVSMPLGRAPASIDLRVQAVYLESGLTSLPYVPWLPTGEVEFEIERGVGKGVSVVAEGGDSFDGDLWYGFFRVSNSSADPIVGLRLEAVDGMLFDFDQQTPNGTAWAGGSTAGGGCSGTYRAGSDLLVGLDYSATPVAGCDVTAQRGFLEDGDSAATMSFVFSGGSFANGATFAWDCDTDGGRGIDGAAMDGMRVRIDFQSGERRSGVLRADSGGAPKSTLTL